MDFELLNRARSFYGRWERPISSLSLVGGFVFDAIALRRIDMFWENFWVVVHLLIVGVFIVLVNSKRHSVGDEGDPHKAQFWYVNILQFFFGGLLSTYLVFYFRSADLATSWFFILILALAFWANESLKRRFVRLSFQISLFFLSLYSFAIFLLPMTLHAIGAKIFILAGVLSLAFVIAFTHAIILLDRERFKKSRKIILFSIFGIFALINILYFTNIIPPIPLSLKDAGAVHSIVKDDVGNYIVSYENYGWKKYLSLYDNIHIERGAPVYVYSAIFSPTDLNIHVIHRWQYFDESLDKWVDKQKTNLALVGGREGGYRTYSMKNSLAEGKWRVSVETVGGQVLGRVRFNIINISNILPLSRKTL